VSFLILKSKMNGKPFELMRSNQRGKRFAVRVPRKDGSLVLVSFGSDVSIDFPMLYPINAAKALTKREAYRKRHAGDHIDDPYTPGFWSWWVNWDKTSRASSFESAVKRARAILDL